MYSLDWFGRLHSMVFSSNILVVVCVFVALSSSMAAADNSEKDYSAVPSVELAREFLDDPTLLINPLSTPSFEKEIEHLELMFYPAYVLLRRDDAFDAVFAYYSRIDPAGKDRARIYRQTQVCELFLLDDRVFSQASESDRVRLLEVVLLKCNTRLGGISREETPDIFFFGEAAVLIGRCLEGLGCEEYKRWMDTPENRSRMNVGTKWQITPDIIAKVTELGHDYLRSAQNHGQGS